MSAHPPRRIYLIDRNFQLKYTLLLVLFGGTVMGASGVAVVRELRANTALLEGMAMVGQAGKLPALADFQDTLAATDRKMGLFIAGISLTVAILLGLIGILYTHRIAGPVYVLSRYAQAIADGGLPQIRALRRGDELKGLFEVFRAATERLRETQTAEVARLEELAGQLSGQPADDLRSLAAQKRKTLGERLVP